MISQLISWLMLVTFSLNCRKLLGNVYHLLNGHLDVFMGYVLVGDVAHPIVGKRNRFDADAMPKLSHFLFSHLKNMCQVIDLKPRLYHEITTF